MIINYWLSCTLTPSPRRWIPEQHPLSLFLLCPSLCVSLSSCLFVSLLIDSVLSLYSLHLSTTPERPRMVRQKSKKRTTWIRTLATAIMDDRIALFLIFLRVNVLRIQSFTFLIILLYNSFLNQKIFRAKLVRPQRRPVAILWPFTLWS